ncbi:MAG: PASTA domain-containing protein [Flavobacterium sp.]|jgi:eukaryotic-like serine/threonine-protein kinase|nr:PASTA domain-containing protein [Flavobacterium sp.]MBP6100266.1 PASTA domain-containing protein [Flavobacterium sp.]
MSLGKYLSSRVFVAQMVAALVLIAVLAFAFFHWITFITHHGDEITVPNLSNLTPEQIEDKLSDLDLDYEIIDTVDYNPAFQKLTIVQQEPTAGSKVKGGRTIYVKLNAATFTMVAVPDLIEKTYRQAVPTLKSIGLLEGEITYVPYIGKDMVRKMMMNGKEIKPGTKVLKSSKIDLVLGDGKVVFDSTEIDSLLQEENQVDTLTNAE